MRNRINMIIMSDYSEYSDGCEYIYTYNRDTDSFTYKWTSATELMSDEPFRNYSLTQVLVDMADFISLNANLKNCTVSINGTVIWESNINRLPEYR